MHDRNQRTSYCAIIHGTCHAVALVPHFSVSCIHWLPHPYSSPCPGRLQIPLHSLVDFASGKIGTRSVSILWSALVAMSELCQNVCERRDKMLEYCKYDWFILVSCLIVCTCRITADNSDILAQSYRFNQFMFKYILVYIYRCMMTTRNVGLSIDSIPRDKSHPLNHPSFTAAVPFQSPRSHGKIIDRRRIRSERPSPAKGK